MSVLFQLIDSFGSKEKVTPEEAKILGGCRRKYQLAFAGAALAGVTLAASCRRKGRILRVILTGVGTGCCVSWALYRSEVSCVNDILSQDGTRMQRELANIIVKNRQHNQWEMQLLSKHFYSERVFDDSNSDVLKLRWRYRNFFTDTVTDGQRSQVSDSGGDSDSGAHGDYDSDPNSGYYKDPYKDSLNEPDSKKTGLRPKPAPMNQSMDVMADPLDCIFGSPATREEIHRANIPSTSPRKLTRSHKRSQRRHRRHLHEAS